MLPTLQEGEVRWSNRWVFRFRPPRKGEVVVVDHPGQPRQLVKRVAGVPGDRVAGRLLGPDEFFVVGDNAEESTDSRSWGPVARRAIRALVRVPRMPRRSTSGKRR